MERWLAGLSRARARCSEIFHVLVLSLLFFLFLQATRCTAQRTIKIYTDIYGTRA